MPTFETKPQNQAKVINSNNNINDNHLKSAEKIQ